MSDVLFPLVLRGPQPHTRMTRIPVFVRCSPDALMGYGGTAISTKSPQNGSLKTAPNRTNLKKNRRQSAPGIQARKKTPSGRGQTSKKYDRIMVLAVFSKAQGSQKGVKMIAKMEPWGTQNHKKQ